MDTPYFTVSRRDFLKTAGAGTALALTGTRGAAEQKTTLPQKVLGRTKVKVPVLGLGTAPAGYREEKDAVPFYHKCIDSGLTDFPEPLNTLVEKLSQAIQEQEASQTAKVAAATTIANTLAEAQAA